MICECLLWLSLASYHFERKDYREFNPGLAVEFKNERVLAGIYRNSFNRDTVFIAYRMDTIKGVALVGGVGTGYNSPFLGAIRIRVGHAALYLVPRGSKTVIGINALLQS